eukprot:4193209-Amphidinium_carterae.1
MPTAAEEMCARLQRPEYVLQQQQQQLQAQTLHIQTLIAETKVARDLTSRRKQTSSSLKLGKPESFKGEESQYEDWIFKMKALIRVKDSNTLTEMVAPEIEKDIFDCVLHNDDRRDIA